MHDQAEYGHVSSDRSPETEALHRLLDLADRLNLPITFDIGGHFFRFGIVMGKKLDAPTHYVLNNHYGDMIKYRGRPAGFYEFVDTESVVGVTVQRLPERLNSAEIVATTHCEIADWRSLSEVRERLFTASPPLLSEAVIRLRDERPSQKPETLGTIYSTPAASDVLRYIWRRISRTMRKVR
jgi:methionyl-tRNA formyltransferase